MEGKWLQYRGEHREKAMPTFMASGWALRLRKRKREIAIIAICYSIYIYVHCAEEAQNPKSPAFAEASAGRQDPNPKEISNTKLQKSFSRHLEFGAWCLVLFVATISPFMRMRGVLIGIAVLISFPALSEEETIPPIVISELLWSGTDLSTADEWIELTNTGTGAMSLSGWILTKLSSGVEEDMLMLPQGSVIGSGALFLISNYDEENSRLGIEADFVDTAMSLINTQLLIRLYAPQGESGRTLIDTVDDGIGDPFAGSNDPPKASMERIDLQSSGTEKTNWRTATTFFNFDDGASLFGTPNAPNGTGPSLDTFPPKEATLFSAEVRRASSAPSTSSGSAQHDRIEVTWVPSISLDLTSQELSFSPDIHGGNGITLPATGTGITFTEGIGGGTGFLFTLRSIDTTGNTSSGTTTVSRLFPDVRITEVLANPIGEDTEEWIEVGNFGPESVDIGGWILDEGNSPDAFTIPAPSLLEPTAHISLRKSQTGLPLDNGDETLSLRRGGTLMDQWTYPETAEEVSFGLAPQSGAGSSGVGRTFQPFCVPTEGKPNDDLPSDPKITIQSGESTAPEHVTLNLIAEVMMGSTVHAACAWDYGDGFTSVSCNPPSHTFNTLGTYSIHLTYTDFCGDTAEKTLTASVTEETPAEDVPSTSGGSGGGTRGVGGSGGGGRTSCAPSATVGVRVSEFLPNPLGSDAEGEWIELQNTVPTTLSLCGWELDDAEGGSTPHLLDSYTIPPEGYLLLPIEKTRITINNDTDHIRLFGPGRILFEDIAFGEGREGESYALQDTGTFTWTPILTPGERNRFGRSTGATSRVTISAALPNPEGLDEGNEWIEITNRGEALIDLTGWTLDDEEGGSTPYRIAGIVLAPGTTHRFLSGETRIILTNTEDSVRLLDGAGKIVSELSWKDAPSGQIILAEELAGEALGETGTGTDTLLPKEYTMQVLFSEVMSNPPLDGPLRTLGEYIELFNPTEEAALLEGWILDDAPEGSSSPRTLGPEVIVPAHGYLLLPSSETRITLNNEGEALSLTSPDGAMSISMTYPEMERGEAYVLVGALRATPLQEHWCRTSLPTPGEENICRRIFLETRNQKPKTSPKLVSSPSPLSLLETKYRPLFPKRNDEGANPPLPQLLADLLPQIAKADFPPLLTLTGGEENTSTPSLRAVLSGTFFILLVFTALSKRKSMV